MATLSDSAGPAIGMRRVPSRWARARRPGREPRCRAPGRSVRSGRRRRSRSRPGPRCPSVASPSGPAPRARRTGSPAATTGRWKIIPAEARTVFGLKRSTDPAQHTTPPAPAAPALRMMVPRLPGSRTSTQTTTRSGRRRSSSSRPMSTVPTIAATGCGVTVSHARARTPACSSNSSAPSWPHDPARSRSAGPASELSRNTASIRAPAAPGLTQQLGAFDHEAGLRLASGATPGQPSQPLDRLVAETQRGQRAGRRRIGPGQAVADSAAAAPDRASRATSTRAPKAASSRTARSASTLRSTSTPAVRSPAIRRL